MLGWKGGRSCPSVADRIRQLGTCHSGCSCGLCCVSRVPEQWLRMLSNPHLCKVYCECLSTLLSLVPFLLLGGDTETEATCKRRHLVGTHTSRGLESMVVSAGSMTAPGKRDVGAGADSFHANHKHKAEKTTWGWHGLFLKKNMCLLIMCTVHIRSQYRWL